MIKMVAMEPKIPKVLPVLLIDLGMGIVGFIVGLAWWRVSGRDTDRDTVIFMVKFWGGIVLFGIVLAFIM